MKNLFQALTAGAALVITAFILADRSVDREAHLADGQPAMSASSLPGSPGPVTGRFSPPPVPAQSIETLELKLVEIEGKLLNSLPSKQDLKRLSAEEAHGMPEAIARAGEHLAELAELIHANPALAGAGTDIYRKCAELEDTSVSVRALCYANFLKWNNGAPKKSPSVPRAVVELAAQVPSS